jgi:hypothetical protein
LIAREAMLRLSARMAAPPPGAEIPSPHIHDLPDHGECGPKHITFRSGSDGKRAPRARLCCNASGAHIGAIVNGGGGQFEKAPPRV